MNKKSLPNSKTLPVKELLAWGTNALKEVVFNPEFEADTLLAHVLEKERTFLYAHPETKVAKGQETRYKQLITRRKKREPFAYLTGSVEFFGLNFKVTPVVLIPRPETEMLVEESLKLAKNAKNIIDIGTGSGEIIITIAKQGTRDKGQGKKYWGLDISKKALAVARQNAKRLVPKANLTFKKSDLLGSLKKLPLQTIVVANLPYLSPTDTKRRELSYEPQVALLGGKEGLDLIYRLVLEFKLKAHSGDHLLLEIGYKQAVKIKDLAERLMPTAKVQIKKDYSGFDRVVLIKV